MAEATPPLAAPAGIRVGSIPLRRLTADQYRNSVRDLLGVRQIETDLPVDEGRFGFFSNTVASVSPLYVEAYARAAELISRQVAPQLAQLLPHDCHRVADDECAVRFIQSFGRRVYRRPLTGEEVDAYRRLFQVDRGRTGRQEAFRQVVGAMLQSPHFLYLIEPIPAGKGRRPPVLQVPPYQLAARLSYFLWNTTPDQKLLDAAQAGALLTREQVAAQVARMIADPRFRDAVISFHLQWLDVAEIEGKEKKEEDYPLWTKALRAAMREETVRFVDHVVRAGDGRLQTLLTARFSFVGGPLRGLYGLPPAGRDAPWERVSLDPASRAGVLTQASVMTVHSHYDRSSLVLRGKMIRTDLLCTELPPPPPDVDSSLPPADPKVSARERFEQHRLDFGCGRCHGLIDPLGSPFESFDAIGALRTMDGPQAIDSRGELTGTARQDGPVADAASLVERLARSEEVGDCVARQWFRYAMSRDPDAHDGASLAAALTAFRQSGYRIPALVFAIATSDAFLYQRLEP